MATNSSSIPLIDLGEESLRHLPSLNSMISGAPVLPLYDAIRPLRHLFQSIEEMAFKAKENFREKDDLLLTNDEAAAIYLLTIPSPHDQSLLKLLNRCLRSHNRRQHTEEWALYLKLLLTALHKLPDYRGIVYSTTSKTNVITTFTRGTNMVFWGLNICSASIAQVHGINMSDNDEQPVLLMIECFSGKNITKYAYPQGQHDRIILLPDSSFKVQAHLSTQSRIFICQRFEYAVKLNDRKIRERCVLEEVRMPDLMEPLYGYPERMARHDMTLHARPFDEFVDDRKEEDQPKGKPKK